MRLWPHVGEKRGKTPTPAPAHANASATITLIAGILGIAAPLLHMPPTDVFNTVARGKSMAVSVVRSTNTKTLSAGIIGRRKADSNSATTAAFRMCSAPQVKERDDNFLVTDAAAQPHALTMAISSGGTQTRQITINVASQIERGMSSWQVR